MASLLCVFFKIDSLVGHPVRSLFPAQYVMRRPTRGALAAHPRSFDIPRFRTGQCLGLDCGMGFMNLSLLVKAWVLLKLQSIAFFYKIDCPLFLPALRLFLFHLSPKTAWGVLWTYRLYAFTHVVLGLVFRGGVLVSSHVCVFRHVVRHLRYAMQSQSVRKLLFHRFVLN